MEKHFQKEMFPSGKNILQERFAKSVFKERLLRNTGP